MTRVKAHHLAQEKRRGSEKLVKIVTDPAPYLNSVLLVTLIYMAGFSGMESTFGFWTEARYGWGAREVGLSFMAVGVVSVVATPSSWYMQRM